MKPVCLYHFPCADGFTAAWVVHQRYGDVFEYIPANYDKPMPDLAGRDVLMVDFSVKESAMQDLELEAGSILVLDHHKTAQAELLSYMPNAAVNDHRDINLQVQNDHMTFEGGTLAIFDMDRSGAGIAWDFFFPGDSRPTVLDHIEDRDLWRFALPGTEAIQAAVFAHEYSFDIWTGLVLNTDPFTLMQKGWAIQEKQDKDVNELVGQLARPMEIGGHVVPVASIPYTMTSDSGHLMCLYPHEFCEDGLPDFAACYWDTKTHRVFSLRSVGRFDVSEIAQQYGGGGHHNAAGFSVPRDHKLAQQ